MGRRTPNQVYRHRDFFSVVAGPNLRVPAVYVMQYNRNRVVSGANIINRTDSAGCRVLRCVVLFRMCDRRSDRCIFHRISCCGRDKVDR